MLFGKKIDMDFHKMMIDSAEVILESANLFKVALHGDQPPATYVKEMKDMEHKGDENTHKIIVALNTVFVTPLDREDIMQLAGKMDDVLDGMEACIARFDYLNINFSDQYMKKFADIIVKSCEHILQSFILLSQKKYLQIREHTVSINQLENEADELMRESIRNIFSDPKDPYHDFKLKEMYERLEETTDRCEDVADILESAILKYA